jgi:hypothetical protein
MMVKYVDRFGVLITFDNYVIDENAKLTNTVTGNVIRVSPIGLVNMNDRKFQIGRLVLCSLATIPPNVQKLKVNYKNGNTMDNRLCNLEWSELQKRSGQRVIAKHVEGHVIEFDTLMHAAEGLGCNRQRIKDLIITQQSWEGWSFSIPTFELKKDEIFKDFTSTCKISNYGRVLQWRHEFKQYHLRYEGTSRVVVDDSGMAIPLHHAVIRLFGQEELKEGYTCRHINGDVRDNRLSNLHVVRQGKHSIFQVLDRIEGVTISCVGVKEVSQITKLKPSSIYHICSGRRNHPKFEIKRE